MIVYGAKVLKPVENYVVNFMKLWDNLDNPQVVESWDAMNTWVTDNIPLAGGAFSTTHRGLVPQRSPYER
jgi:polyhydroxyalkanoate synthase